MTAKPDSEETATAQNGKRHALRDGIDNVRGQASDAAHDAYERAKDGIDQARTAVSDVYASGIDRMSDAYSSARERARTVSKQAADGVGTNPMSALFGGLALGVVIGALLPRTEKETQALGAAGEKLRDLAQGALGAAKEAGQEKLDELGLTPDKARETVKSLLDGAFAAATSAGNAAVDAARQKPDTH